MSHRPRLLVYVLAYNAERFIENTLLRMPTALSAFDTHIVVSDDMSPDRTYEVAKAVRDRGAIPFPCTIWRNPINQGYGGNVKLGIRYAIREGFDAIALTHGDGQYPPELIADYAPIVFGGEADAVFGSRMMSRRGALEGGMPLYKFFGNVFLTNLQNLLLGTNFTEFHTGFRIYSTKSMRRIPYELASNYFDFDTDVTLQFLAAGISVKEAPIPTKYGEETSHVNVIRYGLMIVRSAVEFWGQKRGLFYQRKYDLIPDDRERRYLTPRIDYPQAHQWAVDLVPQGSNVLDIGSGDAIVGAALRAKGCKVTGIDRNPPLEEGRLDAFLAGDLDGVLPIRPENFGTILLLDILNFCRKPEALLGQLRSEKDLKVIVTTGNVGFVVSRLQLLFGYLNYARRGVIHTEHQRLFTLKSIAALLEDNGFKVVSIRATTAPFAEAIESRWVSTALTWLGSRLAKWWPGFFGYRLVLEAESRPSLDRLLGMANRPEPSLPAT